MTGGRVVSPRATAQKLVRPQTRKITEKTPLDFFGVIAVRPEDSAAVARLCERRVGPDSDVARMLGVA